MEIQNVGDSDGFYDLVPSRMNDTKVCLRAQKPHEEQTVGGMYLGTRKFKNTNMYFYRVEKAGALVEELTGVREGDYVFVDMLARYADTFPVSFIDCSNILFKTDADGKSKCALRGRVIVKKVDPKETVNEFGLVQLTELDPYGVVVSIGEGCHDRGYGVGDRVSLHASGTSIAYGMSDGEYIDYDYRVPCVKFGRDDG